MAKRSNSFAALCEEFPVRQKSAKLIASQRNGRAGALARAAKLSDIERQEIAEKAGNGTLQRYGLEFFRHIRKLGVEKTKRDGRVYKAYN